jgi:hypothetical protein
MALPRIGGFGGFRLPDRLRAETLDEQPKAEPNLEATIGIQTYEVTGPLRTPAS